MKKYNIFLANYGQRFVKRFNRNGTIKTTPTQKEAGEFTQRDAAKKMAEYPNTDFKLIEVADKAAEAVLAAPAGGAVGPGATMPTLRDVVGQAVRIDENGHLYVTTLSPGGRDQRTYLNIDITV